MLDMRVSEKDRQYARAVRILVDKGDYESVNDAVELLRVMDDEATIKELSETIRAIVSKEAMSGSEKWYKMYRKVLLLRSRISFDDYMLYLELDREPKERFYMPRRKQLLPIVEALQDLEDNELDELFISQPPRTGKTSIVMFFLTWIMGRHPENTNLYSAFSDTITNAMYKGILEVLCDAYTYKWKDVFPSSGVAETDAKKETIDIDRVKRYKTLTCRSLYGTLNGACDCNGYLISDDLIGGIEEALNNDRLMGAWSKVTNNLMPRAKMSAKKLWVGTRWSLVDPAGLRMDFLNNDPVGKNVRYKIINVPALDDNDESNFNYQYALGFDTEYYKQLRAQFERNDDIASWNSQYQGEPIEREGTLFSPKDMRFYNGEIIGSMVRVSMHVDVAFGGGDYLCAPVLVTTEDDEFISDVVYDNSEKNITQPMVVDCIIRNGVQAVEFESNNGGEGYGEAIAEELKKRGYRCTVTFKSAPTNKRKEQRIYDSAPEIRQCNYLADGYRSKQYQLFMNNIYSFKMFGKNKHDDAPDAMSGLMEMNHGGSKAKVEFMNRARLGF